MTEPVIHQPAASLGRETFLRVRLPSSALAGVTVVDRAGQGHVGSIRMVREHPHGEVRRLRCLVPGCGHDTRSPYSGKDGYICGVCWFRLKLETRRRWWKDTDYSKRPPSAEMCKIIVEELSRAGR